MRRLRRMQLHVVLSFLGIMAVSILGTWYHRQIHTRQTLEMGEEKNLSLTQLMQNAIQATLGDFLARSRTMPAMDLARDPVVSLLDKQIRSLIADLSVVRVKIYNLDGMTIFSTDPKQIGQDQSWNPGVIKARDGFPNSEVIQRKMTVSYDGNIEERSLVSSYIPMRATGPHESVPGIIEVYNDITPLINHIHHSQWQETIALSSILIILYLAYVLLVRRLDRTIRTHERDRRRHLQEIEKHNENLENRVQERTSELSASNLALQTEVAVRRQAEKELCLAATVYHNTQEAIVVTDARGIIQSVNPAFSHMTGFSAEEAVGQGMNILKSGRHDADFYKELWQTLETQGRWQGEIWNRRKNGEIYPEYTSIGAIRDGAGRIIQYVSIFSDISARKESEDRIQFLAHHDALTGLPNRVLLQDRLLRALSFANRFEHLVAVMFLGLDRFKMINESVGRHHGDQLLKNVAARLAKCLRDEDSISRGTGDEFIILASGLLEVRNVPVIADKLLSTFKEPFQIDNESYFLGATIGISLFPMDSRDGDQLLKNAETAMHRAKDQGRGGYQYYTEEMGLVSAKRVTMVNKLRRAIDNNELLLYYQPQIEVATGRLAGVEALIRWRNEELGLVSPLSFIPLAEETNLIVPIGEWVLRTACQQAVIWQEAGFPPMKMAVNVSAKQLAVGNFADTVASALRDTGLQSNQLEVELTEGLFLADVKDTIDIFDQLKGMGVTLSIDDFGTGYSSLSYLKRFRVHTLKIDRAFIRDIITDPDDAAITRTIIAMASSLNMQVVAEGVAAVEQLEFLRSLGCDYVQGFLFSPPVGSDEITCFLEEDRMYRNNPDNPTPSPAWVGHGKEKIIPFNSRFGGLESEISLPVMKGDLLP
ncbi:MAG: EAL domain-containing protein [Magnetococcus sp. DMHC-1]